jgi:tRNA/rRNA methyltransferase
VSDPLLPAQRSPLASLVIVLVRPEGPLNIGSVARLCGNYGCALRLVAPLADPTVREAVMMAHPAEAVLAAAPHFATLAEAISDVELSVGTSSKIADARDGPPLDATRARLLLPRDGARLALVFGNERTGLLLEEAEACTRLMRLYTPGPHDSLNLSHAVATVLALVGDAARGLMEASDAPTRASPGARQQLVRDWLTALDSVGFFKAQSPSGFEPRLQEIVDKMDVSERDTEILRAMMRVFDKSTRGTT